MAWDAGFAERGLDYAGTGQSSGKETRKGNRNSVAKEFTGIVCKRPLTGNTASG